MRRSVRYSASHFFWESGGVGFALELKNLRGDGREGALVATGFWSTDSDLIKEGRGINESWWVSLLFDLCSMIHEVVGGIQMNVFRKLDCIKE